MNSGSQLCVDIQMALNSIEREGYFVWDEFLTPDECQSVLKDFEKLHSSNQFSQSGTAAVNGKRVIREDVRKDQSRWLDPLDLSPEQMIFWNRLEEIKTALNEKFYMGLRELEGHYSLYKPDGFYLPHLDRLSSSDERVISMILYFNQDWKSEDGGELRLHLTQPEVHQIDVSPVAGRLVCFLSAEILHEVLETQVDRRSFAGWWRRIPHSSH